MWLCYAQKWFASSGLSLDYLTWQPLFVKLDKKKQISRQKAAPQQVLVRSFKVTFGGASLQHWHSIRYSIWSVFSPGSLLPCFRALWTFFSFFPADVIGFEVSFQNLLYPDACWRIHRSIGNLICRASRWAETPATHLIKAQNQMKFRFSQVFERNLYKEQYA